MKRYITIICTFVIVLFLASCGSENEPTPVAEAEPEIQPVVVAPVIVEPPQRPTLFQADMKTIAITPVLNARRKALFGDLHVHTRYSFDAFAFGTVASPSDAYRYAKGEAIKHPAGFDMQLKAPLDFYAVTDHAMFLGAVPAASDTRTEFSKLEMAEPFHNLNRPENLNVSSAQDRRERFSTFIPNAVQGILDGTIDRELLNSIAREAWRDTIGAAQAHNEPGRFTTFVAYEYTSSTDERGNLHRNVIFRSNDDVPEIPFSRFHSQNPEGLWRWMDALREQGIDSLAIPHNSNGSNGAMFMTTDWAGNPIDAQYATARMRNEPLVEITQVKGTSETHPVLSPNDEWADFEIMPYRIATVLPSQPAGSYVREAYLNGLVIEQNTGANPYKFGIVGASDTHTGAGSFDEENYFAKIGILDATPQQRGSLPLGPAAVEAAEDNDMQGTKTIDGKVYSEGALQTFGASGLAGVWADENTRDAIFDAFRRKETFGTSGPRLRARLFAGFGFADDLMDQHDWVTQAYASGVPMGSDLQGLGNATPNFVLWAARDASSAPLQRLQIIKGALVNGEMQERVYDVACSNSLPVDPSTHRCPDNGASVDLATCAYSTTTGAGELAAMWRDPDFNPDERAFYYVRALENPTCRWSTWDAVRAGVPPRADLPATIQERVWTSPIWYVPAT